ncbi:Solute carrier family 13 member 1 [Varanus komodoensis]|nr:Solute carrier family 13 member 1 [Varanus komodoensis]
MAKAKSSHKPTTMNIIRKLLVYRRFLLILLTPLLLLPLPLVIRTKEAECAYTLFVVAIFWLTEALPLAVTALLPALMFPMFGIMASKQVASSYFKDFHLLLTGVICLATSIEKWNLHKRIALKMVMLVGVNPAWLTLGFMVSCAFLSMWLSNTSTAAMVMPIVEAVAQQIISAEAEADAIEMTYANGVTNHALELDESINDCEAVDWKEKADQANGYGIGTAHTSHTVCNIEKEKTDSTDIYIDSLKNACHEGQHYPSISLTKKTVRKTIPEGLQKSLPSSINWNGLGFTYDQYKHADYFYFIFKQKPVISQTGRTYRNQRDHMICKVMCLCIAYSSTIGGLTTITGTSTNLIFAEQFNS